MMFGADPLVTPAADLARRPTLLRRLTVVVLVSLLTLTTLWLVWLWRASDQQAEAEVREHLTEEIARFVALFETAWPERTAYLRLEVQNHVSHEESTAMAVVDGAATVLAAHDPTTIGKPLDQALPNLVAPYQHFRSAGSPFAIWRTKNVLWGAARWSITPGSDAVGPDGVILIGYNLTLTQTVLRKELAIALIGPYAAFLATLLIVAGWLWRYHLVPLARTAAMTAQRASEAKWLAVAETAPSRELALLAYGAARASAQIEAQEKELRLLATAIAASPTSVVITDTTPAILWVNPAFERMTGYTFSEVRGQNPSILKSGLTPESTYAELWAKLTAGKIWSGEFINQRKTGELYHEWAVVAPVVDADQRTTHYVAIKFDISREKALSAALDRATTFDPVTNLYNRQAFLTHLDRLLTEAKATPHAIIHLDIAQFGYYNQRFGTAFGDAILTAAAKRLQALMQHGEVAARIGSDEFALLTPVACTPPAGEQRDESCCDALSQRVAALLAALSEPLAIAEPQPGWPTTVTLHWAAGVVGYTGRFSNGSEALAAAALAVARAKRDGVAVAWFSETDAAQLARNGQIVDGLRAALASPSPQQHGLFLVWQPQVKHGHLVGAEVLLRYTHPMLGPISPAEFMPLAESTDLVVALGQWVLTTACQQAAIWQRDCAFAGTISVNVSPRQLLDPQFASQVSAALAASGWPGEHLVLEITENMLLADTERAIAQLTLISKTTGVEWSIDDFGTGYSSLAYLERLPVHELKIDQHFIRRLRTAPESIRLVHAIVQIAETYQLRVVAEGVEDAACVAALAPFPALIHQGWFYGRPVQADEFAATWLGCGATNR